MEIIMKLKYFMILTLSTFMLTACGTSQDQSFGERLEGQGSEVQKLGEQWSDGEKLIVKGKKIIKDGNEDIDDGEDLISKGKSKVKKGENLVRKGERMKTEAENTYNLRQSAY
ncbi:MAG: hypothetical protein CMH25_04975 [Micavibrio sp.]|nr:hypothetical protein [Micavibrio sp.]|tara:strand:- start:580 stop:918 length:339 start_codon:yes stop_codon:yes gene_type:complete